jgi:hypothetical protein
VIIVQFLLIAAFLFLFYVAIRSRTAHSVSASKKLLFLVLMAVLVVAVLAPNLVTEVANLVGVGRGTDLVLYLLAVSFGFYVVNDYLRGQDNQNQLHRLARRIAVLEALERYRLEHRDEVDRGPVQDETPRDSRPDSA